MQGYRWRQGGKVGEAGDGGNAVVEGLVEAAIGVVPDKGELSLTVDGCQTGDNHFIIGLHDRPAGGGVVEADVRHHLAAGAAEPGVAAPLRRPPVVTLTVMRASSDSQPSLAE